MHSVYMFSTLVNDLLYQCFACSYLKHQGEIIMIVPESEVELSIKEVGKIPFIIEKGEHEARLLLDYVRGLSEEALNGEVEYHWARARLRSRPLWQLLLHIVNHGTHHRSEIGSWLATKGQSPKDLDFIKFVARKDQEEGSADR
jgi:uncharacterized damage-inducible protein DinB